MSNPIRNLHTSLLGATIGAICVLLLHPSRDDANATGIVGVPAPCDLGSSATPLLPIAATDPRYAEFTSCDDGGCTPIDVNRSADVTNLTEPADVASLTQPADSGTLRDSTDFTDSTRCSSMESDHSDAVALAAPDNRSTCDSECPSRASAFAVEPQPLPPPSHEVPIALLSAPKPAASVAQRPTPRTPPEPQLSSATPDSVVTPYVPPIQPLPQTYVLTQPQTSQRLLTLTLDSAIQSDSIPATGPMDGSNDNTASTTRRSAATRICGHTQGTFTRVRRRPVNTKPHMSIDFHRATGAIKIDANNVEIKELLSAVAAQTGKTIRCGNSISGTLSASVASEHPDLALRRLLEPFGYRVQDYGDFLYINVEGDLSEPRPIVAAAQPPTKLPAVVPLVAASPTPPAAAKQSAVDTSDNKLVQEKSLPPNTTPVASNTAVTTMVAPSSPPIRDSQVMPTSATFEVPQPNRQAARPRQAAPTRGYVPSASEGRIASLAQDAFASGHDQYAIEVLVEGVVHFPESPMLLRLLGEGYLAIGRHQEAVTALGRAVAIDKKDAYANELLGQTLKHLGQQQRSDHYLMQAMSLRMAAQ